MLVLVLFSTCVLVLFRIAIERWWSRKRHASILCAISNDYVNKRGWLQWPLVIGYEMKRIGNPPREHKAWPASHRDSSTSTIVPGRGLFSQILFAAWVTVLCEFKDAFGSWKSCPWTCWQTNSTQVWHHQAITLTLRFDPSGTCRRLVLLVDALGQLANFLMQCCSQLFMTTMLSFADEPPMSCSSWNGLYIDKGIVAS